MSDLQAADARYYSVCRATFMSPRSVVSAPKQFIDITSTDSNPDAEALKSVVPFMRDDQSLPWNSVDLFKLFRECGGTCISRQMFVAMLVEKFGNDILVLSSPGIATSFADRSTAGSVLHITRVPDDCEAKGAVKDSTLYPK